MEAISAINRASQIIPTVQRRLVDEDSVHHFPEPKVFDIDGDGKVDVLDILKRRADRETQANPVERYQYAAEALGVPAEPQAGLAERVISIEV